MLSTPKSHILREKKCSFFLAHKDLFQDTPLKAVGNNGRDSTDINLLSGDARIAVGDYDGDGFQDIYVFGGGSHNYLFSNNGDGTFSEVTLAAGVDTTAGNGYNDVEFLDFDLDCDLDLFTNGGRYGSNNFFRNNGDGTFTDITALTGLSNTDDTHDIAVGDFNNDGYPDIYEVDFTGYGSSANKLFVNNWPELVLMVDIDIKPGSYPNAINLGSQGLIPVAIFSSEDFDATTVDPDTVELAGADIAVRGKGNKYMAHQEDVDGDGLVDLVVQVGTANLDPDTLQDGWAVLTGETYDGQNIEGEDEITIVPPGE